MRNTRLPTARKERRGAVPGSRVYIKIGSSCDWWCIGLSVGAGADHGKILYIILFSVSDVEFACFKKKFFSHNKLFVDLNTFVLNW